MSLFTLLTFIFTSFSGATSITDPALADSTQFQIPDQPVFKTQLDISMDSLFVDDELFDLRMSDAKEIFSEAIISDMTGDTMAASYQFEVLFEALAGLEELSQQDEFQSLDYNKLLTAAINYYEKSTVSIDPVHSGLSVAVLRDRLNDYIYSQTLEDLEYVEETVEIIPGHIPITYNRKVASIIKYFQNQGKPSVQKWLDRMDRYKAIMLPILEDEGVPLELFYISMIESGLNPFAMSYAQASGFWQFIASTGKVYGLKKTWWVDERRDFEKSTRAAAKYLKTLYAEFNDWYLAFAAYNCGENRVRKIIARQGTRDYWQLSRLPAQTRNYVPNILAALFIANDPAKYGFRVNPEKPLKWKTVNIDKSVSLESIGNCAGVSEDQLLMLNPELRRKRIPPLEKNKLYSLRIPEDTPNTFDSLFALLSEEQVESVVFETHRVRRGESLWLIARKYNVRIQDIVDANRLQNSRYIRPGQKLKIPVSGLEEWRRSTITQSGKKKIYYTVRYGDTLSGIAQRHYTSVRKLKKWNGLRSDFLRAGQKLIIWSKA